MGSDWIGFYFDLGNMALFQYPQHWVHALGKHIKAMHAKDWESHITEGSWRTGKGGNVLQGGWTPLLEGGVNFPCVMAELHAIGFDGPFTNEVDTFLAPMDQTLCSMRKIMAMEPGY